MILEAIPATLIYSSLCPHFVGWSPTFISFGDICSVATTGQARNE